MRSCDLSTRKDQKFKDILSYIPSLWLAWATRDFVSGRKGGRKGRKKDRAGAWPRSVGLGESGSSLSVREELQLCPLFLRGHPDPEAERPAQ